MENYIRDGWAPLKRYLSISLPEGIQEHLQGDTDHDHDTQQLQSQRKYPIDVGHDKRMLDWGIDMADDDSTTNVSNVDLSSPTLINYDYTGNSNYEEGTMDGMTPMVEDKFHDWGISPKKPQRSTKMTIEDVFQQGRLGLDLEKFWDEFRYGLVSSQLLDEVVLISRFKNNRKDQVQNKSVNFQIKYLVEANIGNLDIRIIWNASSLLRHVKENQHRYSINQIRLVANVALCSIALLTDSNIIKLKILHHRILNLLKSFITGFQKFDVLIQKLVTKYKELKIYNNIIIPTNPQQGSSERIHDIITSCLVISTTSVNNSLKSLLPFVNGIELENYCGIYDIELIRLGEDELKPFKIDHQTDPIDSIIYKFKKFQFLTRFLIVVLLAMNLNSDYTTPFLNQVFTIFGIAHKKNCSIIRKLIMISNNLNELTTMVQELTTMTSKSLDLQNTELTNIQTRSNDADDLLLTKVKEFELQLLLARKSNTKISKLSPILDNLTSLYNKECLSQQHQQHILNVEKQRKRFSLPATANATLIPSTPTQRSKSTSHSYKRLSTGLSLPLLTVMEEEETTTSTSPSSAKSTTRIPKRAVSYDDNYLNIMPSHESFGKTEDEQYKVDYIQERNLLSNDDSVVLHNDYDGQQEDSVFDNEQFKKQLELNFTKMMMTDKEIKRDNVQEMDADEEELQVNHNDQKMDIADGVPLMNELRSVLNRDCQEDETDEM